MHLWVCISKRRHGATLQVKVFAQSSFGNQLFGSGGLVYKSSHQLQNLSSHGDQNGCNLEGCMVAWWFILVYLAPDQEVKMNSLVGLLHKIIIMYFLGFCQIDLELFLWIFSLVTVSSEKAKLATWIH